MPILKIHGLPKIEDGLESKRELIKTIPVRIPDIRNKVFLCLLVIKVN